MHADDDQADDDADEQRAPSTPTSTTATQVEEQRLGGPQRQVGPLEHVLDLGEEALALGELAR